MPNRVIKESIKTSEQIDSLTWFEEVLYYRLLVTADDYGCVDGRTILLRNELFPLKENVTKKSVEDAIAKLVNVGLLCSYTANDKPYLFFPTWEKHQRIRNQHRKYPDPFENGVSDICQTIDRQLTADCLSESNTNPNTNPNTKESVARTKFVKPTVDDVAAYCAERKNGIDPQHFVDYYERNGWIVGKTAMKDWKATVRTWEKNQYNQPKTNETPASYDIERAETRAKTSVPVLKKNERR